MYGLLAMTDNSVTPDYARSVLEIYTAFAHDQMDQGLTITLLYSDSNIFPNRYKTCSRLP